ncbi:MAG: ABC transporter permease [Sterolibacterium sp.]|nr:ABC transporter permease [Sterolibacterium sp.]MBP9799473.1 ABC transporter permease [Sterolibacterium sp.]
MNAHAHHPWGLSQLAAPPWRHRHLLGQLIRREVLGRYRGSFLGLLWSFVNPALMISVYTFVFSVVFQARWGASASGSSNRIEFALLLFAGLIVFNLFAECLSQAPSLILNHTSYVKRVVFPLEILPWVTLGSALFHAGINLLVLLVAMTLTGQPPGWMALCWPLVIAPLLLLILGLTWLLASIGVFLRDIGQLVSMALTALMFMSPIFYPASALPAAFRDWLFLNPLTLIIEQTRAVLIDHRPPDLLALGLYTALALAIAWLGFAWFQKTRKGFADVV